jgi:hypothetical protein
MPLPKEIERAYRRKAEGEKWRKGIDQLLALGRLNERELSFVLQVDTKLAAKQLLTEKQYDYLMSLCDRDLNREERMQERLKTVDIREAVSGLPINDWGKKRARKARREEEQEETPMRQGFIPDPNKPRRLITLKED